MTSTGFDFQKLAKVQLSLGTRATGTDFWLTLLIAIALVVAWLITGESTPGIAAICFAIICVASSF